MIVERAFIAVLLLLLPPSVLAAESTVAPPAVEETPGISPELGWGHLVISHFSDDELPSRFLMNVLRTRDGYLWIASFAGLFRYDGVTFELFDQEKIAAQEGRCEAPKLQGSGVYELLEDERGRLWIGSQGSGLLSYEDGCFKSHGFSGSVRAILIDRGGRPWVGLMNGGVLRQDAGAFVPVEGAALAGVTVRDLLEDGDGTVWIATEGRGLVRLLGGAGGDVTSFRAGSALRSDVVTSLVRSRDGDLWIGTDNGLSRLGSDGFDTDAGLSGVEVYRLYEDGYGNLWVASEQGLYRRNATTSLFERLSEHRGRPLRSVSAVAFDREGAVWVTTYAYGLYQLRPGKAASLTTAEGLATPRINALAERRRGGVLVGTDTGRIQVAGEGPPRDLELPVELPDVRVRGLLEDRRGDLWVASYAGLLRLSGSRATWWTTKNGLPSNQVRVVFEAGDGGLWAGTRTGGLVRLGGDGRIEVYDASRGLVSNFVFGIDEDGEGHLLVAAQGGFSRLGRDGRIQSYTRKDGLVGTTVFHAHAAASGGVFLATNGGLARLKNGRITALTPDDGLPAEAIFDIIDDGRGKIYLSSTDGVLRLDRGELLAHLDGRGRGVTVEIVGKRDGLPSRECTAATRILRTADGRLWVPTIEGIAILDPERFPFNRVPPPVVLEGFSVDGEAQDLQEGSITIGPGHKRFRFDFAALSLLVPSAVRVRYRLEGFDDEWTDAGKERYALYTSLPYGRHRFRVIAANDDGVWNEAGASVVFRVEPRFQETRTFFVGLGLMAAALFAAVFSWRVGAMRRRADRLEVALAEQRKAEEALRSSEERYRVLFSEANDSILILDDSEIVDCNARALKMFGFSREELLGMTVEELSPAFQSGEDGGFDGPITQSSVRAFQFKQRKKDGSLFDAEISLGTFRLGDKRLLMAIIRDVSERIRVERERKKLITELEGINEEMKRFTHTVSHDLKSPLFTVKGYLGYLVKDVEAGDLDRARADAGAIRQAVDKMGILIEDLLELSRAGRAIHEPQEMSLTEVAKEVVAHLAGRIEETKATVIIAEDLPVVSGDPKRLGEVFQNLIENAMKFSGGKRPHVEVASRRSGDQTVVYVRDNGIGIDRRFEDRVFGLFDRLDPSVEGTGVGLAIVRRIVEVHGGRVWFESRGEGKGTTFCFTLPEA